MFSYRAVFVYSILTFSFMFSGCVSGPPFSPVVKFNEKKALVYIYRESKILGAAVQHYAYIENKRQVKLSNGGYSVLEVRPGEQDIYFSSKANALTFSLVFLEKIISGGNHPKLASFKAEAGKTYYLKFQLNTWNKDHTLPHSMVIVEEKIGRSEISKTKLVPLLAE